MATQRREKREVGKAERWKAKRKKVFVVLFVLLNAAVIVWTAVSEFASNGDAARLEEVRLKWWMLIPAVAAFAIAVVAEIYKYLMVMRDTWADKEKKFDKKEGWRISRNTVLLGRYYDNITPAAVGGQPFQIFYMNKSGVKGGYGTVIPLIGMITDQLGYLFIGVIAILVGSFAGWITSSAVVAAGWIGLLCYAFFPLVLLAATFLPETTGEIIKIGVRFLNKLHIVKDVDTAEKKAKESVGQYASCIKTVLKQKGLFLKSLVLGMVYYTGLTVIPFFVLQAFGAEIGFFTCFATTAAVSAAVYFIPTPGNAGAAEGTFYSVFSVLPNAGYVFWAMLVWRIFVYYGFIAMGAIVQYLIYKKDKQLLSDWDKTKDKAVEVAASAEKELTEKEGKKVNLKKKGAEKED